MSDNAVNQRGRQLLVRGLPAAVPVLLLILFVLLVLRLLPVAQEQRRISDENVLVELATDSGPPWQLAAVLQLDPAAADDFVQIELLDLRQARRVFLLEREDSPEWLIAIPATVEDGFNGLVDLLVLVDSYGEIYRAVVLEDLAATDSLGMLQWIPSQWMDGFVGRGLRDVRRMGWEKIQPDREYDQFVGASITPKAIVARIYDVLVFYQSNRLRWLELRGQNSSTR